MDIHIADVVESINGRDKDRLFFVINIEKEYALIADGKGRRLEKPKQKKLKHLRFRARRDDRVSNKMRDGEKLTNSDLRRALAEYTAGEREAEGGM